MLDLDDLGAETGQELRPPGQGLHLLDRQDADAVEWLAVAGGAGVGGVSQSHVRASGVVRDPATVATPPARHAARPGGRRAPSVDSAACEGSSATGPMCPTGGSTA